MDVENLIMRQFLIYTKGKEYVPYITSVLANFYSEGKWVHYVRFWIMYITGNMQIYFKYFVEWGVLSVSNYYLQLIITCDLKKYDEGHKMVSIQRAVLSDLLQLESWEILTLPKFLSELYISITSNIIWTISLGCRAQI